MSENIKVVQQREINRQKQLKADYEDIFDSPKGQRVLDDIKASGVWKRSAFTTDAMIMAANVAKQDFARHIVEMATRQEPNKAPKQKRAIKK